MRQIYVQKTTAKCGKFTCKKQCEMRQIYMQKTQRNALLFCKFFIYFLHMNLAHFSVFFAGKFAGNCMVIFHIFRAFSWWFFMGCVRGWERRDPGKIPVKMRQSRSGLHWKYSFLQRDVNEKRDCESYRRKTVDPSFEPQTSSVMLKMRFLRRSGRKYEKSCSYGHGVSWGLAKNVCLVCANCEKSRKKCEKMRKSAKKCKKSRKKLVKSGNLWDDRQVMGCQVIGGCTVKSTAWGRNRTF